MTEAADQYLGDFTISGRKLPGVVNLKDRDSRLEVFADRFVHLREDSMRTIRGVACSGEKLTICDAIGAEVSGTSYS